MTSSTSCESGPQVCPIRSFDEKLTTSRSGTSSAPSFSASTHALANSSSSSLPNGELASAS